MVPLQVRLIFGEHEQLLIVSWDARAANHGMLYLRQLSLITARCANFLAANDLLGLIVFDYAFSAIIIV